VEINDNLSEPWTFHFPYKRATGPVVGRFLDGLRERRIFGLRMRDGGVLVPPHAHDPKTSESLDEWVEVAGEGVVTSWTWIPEPLPQHPLDRPFAYALVQLDGASTGLFHVVDAGSIDAMSSGMRVRADWADEPKGHITDLRAFVPANAASRVARGPSGSTGDEPTTSFDATFTSDYEIIAGKALSVHLRGLAERRLIGLKGSSGNVFLPPNGADALTGEALVEPVELAQTGTVVRYCIVNIPVRGQQISVPFAAADVLIDGCDTTFMALIQGLPHRDVRLGLRVRAVWVDDDLIGPRMESIKWFEPAGEPDADLAALERYL